MAVPNATPLVENMARAQTGQMLQDRGTGLAIQGMRDQTALAREDMRMARQDAGAALAVTGMNLGGQMLVNRERTAAQKEAEERAERERLYHGALDEIYDTYKERYMKEVLGGGK
jgi:hypothetical protein